MQNNRMKRSLLLLNFLNGLVFYAPVSLLVRTQMGITVSQVFWLQAVLDAFVCDYNGETYLCAAVPEAWRGAEYHNLRTKDGVAHSGKAE